MDKIIAVVVLIYCLWALLSISSVLRSNAIDSCMRNGNSRGYCISLVD